MAANKKLYYGRTASPTIDPLASIQVRSVISYGDGDNAGTTNYSNARANIFWGWPGGAGQYRVIPITQEAIASALPSDATISRAVLVLGLCARCTYPGYVFPGNWRYAVYALEKPVGAGLDYNNPMTSVNWNAPGNFGPAAGYDFPDDPIGYYDIDSTLYNALSNVASNSNALAVVRWIEIDITEEVKRAYLSAGSPLQLIAPVIFGKPPAGNGSFASDNLGLLFDNPANAAFNSDDHSHIRIEYTPTLGVVGADTDLAGGPPDFNNLHDPAAPGLENRTYVGAIEIGSVGVAKKLYANNYSPDGQRKLVVIGTGRSEARVVDNSGSVSGETLRSIDVYDNAPGVSPAEKTETGEIVLEPASGTTYKVSFTPKGGSAGYLLEQGTGLDTVSFSADHVFMYASKKHIKIRTAKFSATSGWSTSDRLRCSLDGDQRQDTQSIDTLKLIQICPPTSVNGDTASTAAARPLWNAFTQKLWAPVSNVDIGGTTHGHIEVLDTVNTDWGEGELLDIFTADGSLVATATLEAIFRPTHAVLAGSYPDTLRINRAFTGPELAAFNEKASVTGGLFIGAMAAFQLRRLGAPAAIGQNQIQLNQAFSGTPGKVKLIDTSAQPSVVEDHVVESGSGTLTLTDNLGHTLPMGTLVINVIDGVALPNLASFRSYFAFGDIPADQDMGLYSNYYKLFEHQLA